MNLQIKVIIDKNLTYSLKFIIFYLVFQEPASNIDSPHVVHFVSIILVALWIR